MSVISTIEADASKVLNWLTGAQSKVSTLGPTTIAGLGTILGAVATALKDGTAAAAQSGINISLDAQTATDVEAVWSDIEKFATSIGIKL